MPDGWILTCPLGSCDVVLYRGLDEDAARQRLAWHVASKHCRRDIADLVAREGVARVVAEHAARQAADAAKLVELMAEAREAGGERYTSVDHREWARRYQAGESLGAIAGAYGASSDTVRLAIVRRGVKLRTRAEAEALKSRGKMAVAPSPEAREAARAARRAEVECERAVRQAKREESQRARAETQTERQRRLDARAAAEDAARAERERRREAQVVAAKAREAAKRERLSPEARRQAQRDARTARLRAEMPAGLTPDVERLYLAAREAGMTVTPRRLAEACRVVVSGGDAVEVCETTGLAYASGDRLRALAVTAGIVLSP